MREALPAILASPKFLYRAERTPAGVAAGAVHRITPLDLASRLSFFLTGRGPDDELLRLAEQGTLAEPEVLDAQVRRLLAAPTVALAGHHVRVPVAEDAGAGRDRARCA